MSFLALTNVFLDLLDVLNTILYVKVDKYLIFTFKVTGSFFKQPIFGEFAKLITGRITDLCALESPPP